MTSSTDYLAKTSQYPVGLTVSHAEGSYIFDTEGKKYLDLIAGIGVSYVGHSNKLVKESIKEQLDLHSHVMVYGEYPQSIQNSLSKELIEILGPPFDQVYLTNSGTEANEGALKLAKRFTGRSELIAFKGAYHGSTHGSLSVSDHESRKSAFRPLLPDVKFLEFNSLEDLHKINSNTAAVIIEPIQGDAGVRIPSQEFLKMLRHRCSETGTILIFDEIQTGMGRTGDWFAFQKFLVTPDIITLGKALGAGLPLGGFAARREMMEKLTVDPPLGHITTYGGNPICCASALGGINYVKSNDLIHRVEEKGAQIERQLDHAQIKSIRRVGLMLAIDLESADKVTKEIELCRAQGVLIYWFLSTPASFRIAPPLTISASEIEEGCAIIQAALDSL